MKVTILGPNLPDQSRGTCHVHKDGCGDITTRQYASVIARGEVSYGVEAASQADAAAFMYPRDEFDGWAEGDGSEYIDDLWFAPCVKGLPRASRPEGGSR